MRLNNQSYHNISQEYCSIDAFVHLFSYSFFSSFNQILQDFGMSSIARKSISSLISNYFSTQNITIKKYKRTHHHSKHLNGVIGGLILLLSAYALKAGYIVTLIIIMCTGIFSYYSCYFCLLYLGDHPGLDYAILRHFDQSVRRKLVTICVSGYA